MEPNENIVAYADWVLLLACEAACMHPVLSIDDARALYVKNDLYRALCDMIAKHEQPPVDPDEKAVKRILEAANIDVGDMLSWNLARAVDQYKQEKANG